MSGNSLTSPRSRALWATTPLEFRDSIRVLALAPDADLEKGVIRCTFDVLRLSNIKRQQPATDSYSALSYTWGDGEACHVININSFPVWIRPSLFETLPQIWMHNPGERLWVDAVCIDQENDTEKMEQVSQMDQIYASADTVHVWLGLQGPRTGIAWRFLQLVYEDAGEGLQVLSNSSVATKSKFYTNEWRRLEGFSRSGFLDDFEVVELPGKLVKFADCVDSVKELLYRAWWSRLWTYQEILLAAQCTINCGPLRMGWGEFCSAVEEIDRIRPRPQIWPDEWARGIENVRSLTRSLNFRRHRAGMMKRMPPILTRLLLASNERRATDPKDRVFGLLGLVDTRQYPLLKPDYTQTVKQVYTRTTQACILATQSVEILNCAGLAYRTPNPADINVESPLSPDDPQRVRDRAIEARLPSWVPNLNSQACIGRLSASYLDLNEASWDVAIVAEKADVKLMKSPSEFQLKLRGCVLGYFQKAVSSMELALYSTPPCRTRQKASFFGSNQPIIDANKVAELVNLHVRGGCGCDPFSKDRNLMLNINEMDLPLKTKPGDWLCRLDSGHLSSPYVLRPTPIRSETEFLLVGHAPQTRQKLRVSADQRHIWTAYDTERRFESIKLDLTLY